MRKRIETFFEKLLPSDYVIDVNWNMRYQRWEVVFSKETDEVAVRQGGGFYIKSLRDLQKNSWWIMQSLRKFRKVGY